MIAQERNSIWAKRVGRSIAWLTWLSVMAGCSWVKNTPIGDIVEERDGYPDQSVSVAHIPDAVPREEIRTIAGNLTPYRVLGRTYHVMQNPNGYRESGYASWYGTKFHGKRTSNGEIYNMYGMTAAHKTLPIPSYVRVTNTHNKRSVVVRVNDRGPFHGDRIIDLTYTAAKKLGFENSGTAPVIVEYIDPKQADKAKPPQPLARHESGEPPAPTPTNSAGYQLPANTYLQVGAFSQAAAANEVQVRLRALTNFQVWVLEPQQKSQLYKVQIGPFSDNFEMMTVRQKLIDANFTIPHVVYR